MIQQKAVINNSGPVQVIFEDVVAGSSLSFSFFFEQEEPEGSGTYEPMDFTGHTFVSQVRRDLYSTEPTAVLDAEARVGEPGWVDFKLGATKTGEIGQADVHWSFKSVPDADPEDARHLLFGIIPIVWRGTR